MKESARSALEDPNDCVFFMPLKAFKRTEFSQEDTNHVYRTKEKGLKGQEKRSVASAVEDLSQRVLAYRQGYWQNQGLVVVNAKLIEVTRNRVIPPWGNTTTYYCVGDLVTLEYAYRDTEY